MSMELPEHIREAYNRHKAGCETAADRQLLDEWILPSDGTDIIITSNNPDLRRQLYYQLQQELAATIASQEGAVLNKPAQVRYIAKLRMVAIWAMVIIIGGVIGYTVHKEGRPVKEEAAILAMTDKSPAATKATLLLANGSSIELDGEKKEGRMQENGMELDLSEKGTLIIKRFVGYKVTGVAKTVMNTLTVPAGGQFKVVLPDGSTVRLNAASVLRFPDTFPTDRREVLLEGEAYFDIAPDHNRPFLVKANHTAITVLGTTFNISAYPGESQKTTLLSGKIKLRIAGQSKQKERPLKPGQQALVTDADTLAITDVNVEEAAAWTKNQFVFDAMPLEQAMRQIARWYNIEVSYTAGVPKHIILEGSFPRTIRLKETLHILNVLGVHYRIDNTRIVILP